MAGEFSWNKGTTTYNTKNKGHTGINLQFFCLKTFKKCTWIEKLNHRCPLPCPFPPKIRALFSYFRRRAMETSPLSTSSYALVTWLRPRPISLDVYGSKIRKARRCRPVASNETNLATRQEFYLTKVATVQSINGIILLDFSLIQLSWMFISCYTTIYFFVKKFIFSNVYVPVNTIFECLDMFFDWDRGNQLSTYATGRGTGGHPKWVQLRTGGGGLTPHVYVRTYTISFHVLVGFLSYSVLFICRNLT